MSSTPDVTLYASIHRPYLYYSRTHFLLELHSAAIPSAEARFHSCGGANVEESTYEYI